MVKTNQTTIVYEGLKAKIESGVYSPAESLPFLSNSRISRRMGSDSALNVSAKPICVPPCAQYLEVLLNSIIGRFYPPVNRYLDFLLNTIF